MSLRGSPLRADPREGMEEEPGNPVSRRDIQSVRVTRVSSKQEWLRGITEDLWVRWGEDQQKEFLNQIIDAHITVGRVPPEWLIVGKKVVDKGNGLLIKDWAMEAIADETSTHLKTLRIIQMYAKSQGKSKKDILKMSPQWEWELGKLDGLEVDEYANIVMDQLKFERQKKKPNRNKGYKKPNPNYKPKPSQQKTTKPHRG